LIPNRVSLFAGSLLAALFLLSGPAFGQTTTGKLKGEVVDQADTPLAGVKMTLSSDSLLGTREIVTGEDGRFQYLALPPGTYRVDVEKEGFKTIIRTNLVISLGKTINIKLVMELPEIGETVEVIDRRPLIDTESTTQSLSLNADFLKNLPSGRSFQDVVQFLPGVTGGGNPNINGGTSQSNQYYLDGSNTTDPVTGTFSMNFNFDAIEDLEVITAGYDARYNQGLGGTINIVTKSGGNTFEGTFSGYYETSGLQAAGNRYNSQRRSDFDSLEGNASLGGPIIKDRFWFYLAYQYNWSRALPASNIDNGRDFALFPLSPRTWSSHFILAKLTAQPFAQNKVTFSFRADPTDINNIDAGNVYTIDAGQRLWRQGGLGVSLAHEVQILGRAVLTTTASYNYTTIIITPQSWKNCQNRDARSICLDEDLQQITTWGGFGQRGPGLNTATGNYNLNRRHNLQIRTDLSIGLDRLLGSHSIDAGVSVQPIWENFEFGYHRNQILINNPTDADGSGFYESDEVSDIDNYTRVGRYLIVNTEAERAPGVIFNAYLQDRWSPTRGLLIVLGGRFLRANLQNNLGEPIVDTTAISWGTTVGWDPFRDGRTYLMAAYSQNVDPGILQLSTYINQSAFASEFYPWEPDQRRYAEDGGRATSPGSNITHPDFVPARSHEIFVRAQREIARDLAAEANFIYRDFTNMWEDDEVNFLWNKDGTNPVGFRNGADTTVYRLRTPQDGHRTYWALQLVVRKQLSDNFEMLASYSFSRLLANSAGRSFEDRVGLSVDFDNPTQRYYEDGIAAADQTHILKIAATYDSPGVWKLSEKFSIGYAVGGTMDFASGPPLDRLQLNEYFGSYTNYLDKRGTKERLPAHMELDLRASLALTIASTQVDIIVQAFNLLNSTDIASADRRALDSEGEAVVRARGDAVYASPTSYYRPRRFELGVRFSF
jgi:hypothetical protein